MGNRPQKYTEYLQSTMDPEHRSLKDNLHAPRTSNKSSNLILFQLLLSPLRMEFHVFRAVGGSTSLFQNRRLPSRVVVDKRCRVVYCITNENPGWLGLIMPFQLAHGVILRIRFVVRVSRAGANDREGLDEPIRFGAAAFQVLRLVLILLTLKAVGVVADIAAVWASIAFNKFVPWACRSNHCSVWRNTVRNRGKSIDAHG